jgi:cellulase (glycosyl hydrolase family 5)
MNSNNKRNFSGSRSRLRRTILLVLILVLTIVGGLGFFRKNLIESGKESSSQQGGTSISLSGQSNLPPSTISLSPNSLTSTPLVNVPDLIHVQGNQIIDGSGHPLILRGAHITSSFNYILAWNHGANPFGALNPSVFATVHSWGMNIVRIPISFWIYQLSPVSYMAKLDSVIQQANAAQLYVVIDNHDDDQSGSPYGSNADVPKPETIAFWKVFASHYKYNPEIMFDIINEPKQTNWSSWLHGGGFITGSTGKTAPIVGMQDVVDAIRSVGAPQIVIAEAPTTLNGFEGIGNNLITDPNVMYSIHEYFDYARDNHKRASWGWDQAFGDLGTTHPIFIGEWAFLPNANYPVFCENITAPQAEQLVGSFLLYMQQHQVNWTAWNFDPYHLIQDYTYFTPTTLDIPWRCGDTSSHAGMGSIVKQFLIAHP